MKILHVLNHSVPHTDGYCVRSANIVQYQKKLGWDPLVVTSPRQEPIPTDLVETIDGIRYHRTLPRATRLPFPAELKSIWHLQRRIEEIVRNEQPDIIHAHSPCSWGYAAAKVACQCKLPFVYEIRGVWEDGAVDQGRLKESSLKYRLRRALESHVARKATTLVTISEGLKREFLSRGMKKLFLVPNGVDLKKFNGEPIAAMKKKREDVTIGYIGSLYSWEGVEDLVRAASLIRKKSTAIRIQIIGDGEAAPAVHKLIEQHSLSDTVEMVGRIPHDKIDRAYDSIDILVYPRRSSRTTELVTPLKPLEAMAQKKPIIVSNVGGLLELVDDKVAAIFTAGNADNLASKCLELAEDVEGRRQMGLRAHEYVHRYRNWSTIIEIYRDVYRDALSASTE